jgi:glutathione S-transferase
MTPVKLYGIPSSNSVLTVQLAMEHKGVDYRRVDLIPAQHRVGMLLRRFGGGTVPGIVIDGRKVHGSIAIMRVLDEARTGPALFPADPLRRREIEEALRWGEEMYQRSLRFVVPYALRRRPSAIRTLLEDSRMIVPNAIAARTSRPNVWISSRYNHSNEREVRRTLADLPAMFDRIDAWIASGLLDATTPSAADFMIAPTTRAYMWFDDLRPAIEDRPCGKHALAIAPHYPGHFPPLLPGDALAPFGALVG